MLQNDTLFERTLRADFDQAMRVRSAKSLRILDNQIPGGPIVVGWLVGPREHISESLVYAYCASSGDVSSLPLAALWRDHNTISGRRIRYHKGNSPKSYRALALSYSPETTMRVLASAYSLVTPTDSMDMAATFDRSLDAPLTTRVLLDEYYDMRDRFDIDKDSHTNHTVGAAAFDAYGYECEILMHSMDHKVFDHEGMSMYKVCMLSLSMNKLNIFMPYDPGSVYSVGKVMKWARSAILEAVDGTGPSGLVIDTSEASMTGSVMTQCSMCRRDASEMKPEERVRVAATHVCKKCTTLHERLGDYKKEEGVIPSV